MISALALAAAFLTPAPAPCQDDLPRLVFESKAGQLEEVSLTGLSLSDPREQKAWFVRPRGFDARRKAIVATGSEGDPVEIELVGGDVLNGHVVGGQGETISMRLLAEIEFTIDISRLRRMSFLDRLPRGRVGAALSAAEEGDLLYRWTGRDVDPIGGTVESFSEEGVRFDNETVGSQFYEWSKIAGLFVEVLDEDLGDKENSHTPVVLDLVDGSRMTCRLLELAEEGCRIEAAGEPLLFPWAAIHELAVNDGSMRYLSELEPTSEEGRGAPFGDDLGMVWDHRIDRCVDGSELRSGGRTYQRGIGMHAPTRVTWRLDGSYARLRALVGLDDSSLLNPPTAHGSVKFKVWLDGKLAWESGVLRGGDPAAQVPSIELGDATELALEADMVGDFQGDRANWLRVLLMR